MDDRTLELLIISGVYIILLITGYIMPDAVRKEICFGVRIPWDKAESPLIKSEKSEYKRRYILSCGIYVLVIIMLMWNMFSEWIFAVGLIIFGIISYINFYISYRNMKNIKEQLGRTEEKEYVVVDTDFRNSGKKVLVSPFWFLIPIVLASADFITGAILYSRLPEKIAIHWNISGTADGFAVKSFRSVFGIPVNILVLTVIFYITYRLIKRAKQQINTKDAINSLEKSRRFRLIGSGYIAGISVLTAVINTIDFFKAISVINIENGVYQAVSVLFLIILVASPLALVLFIGQGGSRLNIHRKDQKDNKGTDRSDDSFWKLGMFYFNPSDPSIMVEKRFGVGWTINFGNMKAVLVFAVIIAVIIVSSILMKP